MYVYVNLYYRHVYIYNYIYIYVTYQWSGKVTTCINLCRIIF
jgi:hypothetical protein